MNVNLQTVGRETDEVALLLQSLRSRHGPDAVVSCLRAAASLVEHAAYEMAQSSDANHVAQLILTASNLERIAQTGTGRS